jgi:exopolysaccharide production protein ExoQ
LTAVGVALMAFVVTHLAQVTELLGKSVTLTGRLQLWMLSIVVALDQPWFGYGYDAFWGEAWQADRIQRAVGWAAPHAHNGFVEIWLEMGFLGVAIFCAGLIYYLVRSLKFLAANPAPEAILPVLFLIFVCVMNLTEVPILGRNTLFGILYAALATSTAPDRSEALSTLSHE